MRISDWSSDVCSSDLLIDQIGNLRRRTRRDLLDRGNTMRLVARVNALGAVAREEILVKAQSRNAFQHRYALFFGRAGIHRGFVNYDIATLEYLAYGFTGTYQGRQRSEEHTSELQSLMRI